MPSSYCHSISFFFLLFRYRLNAIHLYYSINNTIYIYVIYLHNSRYNICSLPLSIYVCMYVLSVCDRVATIRLLCCLFFLLCLFVCLKYLYVYTTLNKYIKIFFVFRLYSPCIHTNLVFAHRFLFFLPLMCANIREIFNRSCYLLIVSIASSRCCPNRLNALHASLNHHVWLDFCVRWPTILSVDYRGKFANWRIRPKFLAPKTEHSFEFDDNHLRVCVSWSHVTEKKISLEIVWMQNECRFAHLIIFSGRPGCSHIGRSCASKCSSLNPLLCFVKYSSSSGL